MHFLITSLVIVSLFVSKTLAHGHLAHPGVFTGLADQRANQNQVNNCGLVSNAAITDAMKRFPPTFVQPGASVRFTYTVTNGDGAGPLNVDFDTTGAGTTFNTPATITTQVPGNNANLNENQAPGGRFPGDFPLGLTIPANLNCPSGACIMRVRNPQNFISCMFVTTDPRFSTAFPAMFPSDQQVFLGNALRNTQAQAVAAVGGAALPATGRFLPQQQQQQQQQGIAGFGFNGQGFAAGAPQQQAGFGAIGAQQGIVNGGVQGFNGVIRRKH